ncbi:unnamed protein product [Rangifer tarandus platyrhynchus]|uniref:Uncharacterized protein n=1 Tax=Rangifer tarandus platyrhynchus TaxID=3082113 RepID=A0ABN8XQF6_RANTA|nr:unnamed protein product [Rangifer tarandus platyrhynchus]
MKTAAGQEGCFRRRTGFLGPPGALAQGRVRMWLEGRSRPMDVRPPLFTSVSRPQTGLEAHRHAAAPVHFCLLAPDGVGGPRTCGCPCSLLSPGPRQGWRPTDTRPPLFTSVSWPQTGLEAHGHAAAPVHFCLLAPNSIRGSHSSPATLFHTVKSLKRVSNENVLDK